MYDIFVWLLHEFMYVLYINDTKFQLLNLRVYFLSVILVQGFRDWNLPMSAFIQP